MTIKDLEPKLVWQNFYELTRIPRPSKHEEKVEAYLYEWGKSRGFDTIKDPTGNIIISVPATPGYENRRGVIFQGHMDMVPQKNSDVEHDFLTDPIETEVKGDWVCAKGTTLGADNGIGLALGLAVLEDKTIKHGPIEILATYDEETGMTGAESLPAGLLKGDILLNLDSEDEGELCIGCAGGMDAGASFPYETVAVPSGYVSYKIGVKGLQGGHSGMDISLYRGNAIQILARALYEVMTKCGALLVDMKGGSLRNAIPFESEAVLAVPSDKAECFKAAVTRIFEDAADRYKESDPNMVSFCEPTDAASEYIDSKIALKAVGALIAAPSNVIRMSQSMPGLTETSVNLGVLKCTDKKIYIHSLLRSALDSSKDDLALREKIIFENAGAEVAFTGGYAGWLPKPDLPIIEIMKDTYKKLFGKEMVVNATHGGLECAILGAKYPNWEMVSIGPTIVHPHSPDERLKIDTVQMTWDYIKALLEAIPEAK